MTHSLSIIARRSAQPRLFINWLLVLGLVLPYLISPYAPQPVQEAVDEIGSSFQEATGLIQDANINSYLPAEMNHPFANGGDSNPFAHLQDGMPQQMQMLDTLGARDAQPQEEAAPSVLEQVAQYQSVLNESDASAQSLGERLAGFLNRFNHEPSGPLFVAPIDAAPLAETVSATTVGAETEVFLPVVMNGAADTTTEPPTPSDDMLVYESPDGQVVMEIPRVNFDVEPTLSYTPLETGNLRMIDSDAREVRESVKMFDIRVDSGRGLSSQLLNLAPATVSVSFADVLLNDLLTGEQANRLVIHGLNPVTNMWQPLLTSIDFESQLATASIQHFTTFSLVPSMMALDPCAEDFELAPQDTYNFVNGTASVFHNFTGEFTHFIGTNTYLFGRETPDMLDVLPTEISDSTNEIDTHDTVQILFPQQTYIKQYSQLPLPPEPLDTSLNGTYFPVFPPAPNTPRVMTHTLSIQLSDSNATPDYGSTGYYIVRDDVSPPGILEAWSQQDGAGGVYVEVRVIDNCAIDRVTIEYQSSSDGTWYSANMIYLTGAPDGLGRYGAPFNLPTTGVNSYRVTAYDMARPTQYTDVWTTSELSAYSRIAGEMFFDNCTYECGGRCTAGSCGDPISTVTGNFTIREEDANISGRSAATALMMDRTYNASSVQRFFNGPTGSDLGPFGLGWTSPQTFKLEIWNNLLLQGAKVIYPDGHSARFSGMSGMLTSLSPNETDTLELSGGTYILRRKDLTEHRFSAAGQLLQSQDANGNTLTYSQSAAGPTQITNNAGRSITIGYSQVAGHDVITSITDGSGLLYLSYAYNVVTGVDGLGAPVAAAVLSSISDARNQTTRYFYDNQHRLIEIRTPEGHSRVKMTYDAQGRVTEQTVGAGETYEFTYDDANFVRTVEEAGGFIETHQYDADYRLTSLTDNEGYVEAYTYNADNLRQTLTDKNGNTYTYTYDGRSNLTRTTGPEGFDISYTYNGQDRPLTFTDSENRTTQFAYDGAGNLTGITNADGNPMSIVYNGDGQPTRITDYNGNVIKMTYSGAGDLASLENGEGETVTFAYDGLGRMTSMTTDEGHTFSFTYDVASELMRSTSGPLGYNMSYTYDKNGNLETETDARGNTTTYDYDTSENLVSVLDPENGTTFFGYDAMNNLTSLKDEEGRTTTYIYDGVYNLTEIRAPENRTTEFDYDGNQNITQITDGEGRQTQLAYDGRDRLTKITDALNGDIDLTYDKVDNILSISDANSHITNYEYDVLNRLTKETDAESQVTTYSYDNNGNLLTVTDAENNVTTLTYDRADRLETITNAEAETVTFAYGSLGNIVDLTQPNGVNIHWEYDGLYRPTALTQNFGGSVAPVNVTYDFEYDLNGNLTRVTDPENNASAFSYDKLNRLKTDTNALGNAMVYGYDKVDNLTSVQDRRGNVTTLIYDDADRLREVRNALGDSSFYSYDRADNLLTYTDENGNVVTMTYDDLDRLDKVTNPENHAVDFDYDAVGNLLRFTDARLNATEFEYDDVNRLTTSRDARGGETNLTYDGVGNVLTVNDANGHVTTIDYDRAYRTTVVTDAENFTTQFAYDANGNVVKVTDGNNHDTVIAYDPLDRITSVTNAENETTSYTYDLVGNLVDIIENDGITKRYGYDAIYQLTSVTLNAGGVGGAWEADVVYDYGYDENGNLETITDPRNSVTTFTYDALNRVSREVNPIGNQWDYSYDKVGNLLTRTDGNRETTNYSYYTDDQLKSIAYSDGDTVTFSYDENNNLTQMVDWLGVTAFAYDELNRITSINDALSRQLEYEYDAVGNVTQMTYPNGTRIEYQYDDNDWLRSMEELDRDPTDPQITTYTRNGVGQMTHTQRANGATTEADYDKANRMLKMGHYESDGSIIHETTYTLNDVGLRDGSTVIYGRPWPKTTVETYEYDGLRRLTAVNGDYDGDSTFEWRADYQYDAAGNRELWRVTDDQMTPDELDPFSVTYTYNAANQLIDSLKTAGSTTVNTNFTYDDNGNRINKTEQEVGHPYTYGTDYAYDRADRLTSVENYRVNDSLNPGHRRNREETVMEYDGMGRRLVKTYSEHDGRGRVDQTEYVFDGLDIVAEYPVYEDGEQTGRDNHRNEFYLNDQREIVTQRRFPNGVDAQTYQYHTDGRKDVLSLSDESTRSWIHYDYSAFGQELDSWGGNFYPERKDHNNFSFSGKERDENSNIHYFGSRFYDSVSSTWTNQDRYRGQFNSPQSLHRYGYVLSSPINYADIWGFCADNEDCDFDFVIAQDTESKFGTNPFHEVYEDLNTEDNRIKMKKLIDHTREYVENSEDEVTAGEVSALMMAKALELTDDNYADATKIATGSLMALRPTSNLDPEKGKVEVYREIQIFQEDGTDIGDKVWHYFYNANQVFEGEDPNTVMRLGMLYEFKTTGKWKLWQRQAWNGPTTDSVNDVIYNMAGIYFALSIMENDTNGKCDNDWDRLESWVMAYYWADWAESNQITDE